MDYKYLNIPHITGKEISQRIIILQVLKMISLSKFIQLMRRKQKEVHHKIGLKI